MKDAVAFMRWERVVPWKILSFKSRPTEPPVPVGFGSNNRDFSKILEPGSQIWVVTRIAKQFSLAGRVTVLEIFNRDLYENVRIDGTVRSCAVLIAAGVRDDGKRSLLGVSCSMSEAEVHWRTFLSGLKQRGLHGVQMITSDDHEGLKAARFFAPAAVALLGLCITSQISCSPTGSCPV